MQWEATTHPISTLDLVCALVNHRPEPKLSESASQSVARIKLMSNHMSKPYENLPCSTDFYDTLLTHASLHSHCISYRSWFICQDQNSQNLFLPCCFRHLWKDEKFDPEINWIFRTRNFQAFELGLDYMNESDDYLQDRIQG